MDGSECAFHQLCDWVHRVSARCCEKKSCSWRADVLRKGNSAYLERRWRRLTHRLQLSNQNSSIDRLLQPTHLYRSYQPAQYNFTPLLSFSHAMTLLFEQRQRWPQKYFFGWNWLRMNITECRLVKVHMPHTRCIPVNSSSSVSRAPGWLKAFTARVDTMMIYYYNGDIADSISSQTDEEGVVFGWERASMCACGDFNLTFHHLSFFSSNSVKT